MYEISPVKVSVSPSELPRLGIELGPPLFLTLLLSLPIIMDVFRPLDSNKILIGTVEEVYMPPKRTIVDASRARSNYSSIDSCGVGTYGTDLIRNIQILGGIINARF